MRISIARKTLLEIHSLKNVFFTFCVLLSLDMVREGGRGGLVYLSEGDLSFFKVSYLHLFASSKQQQSSSYREKAHFIEEGVLC